MLYLQAFNETLIQPLAEYWYALDKNAMLRMGVDENKIPDRKDFEEGLLYQINQKDTKKKAFALIAFVDDEAIGHCNLNPIQFGEIAKMHLHIWKSRYRKSGLGTEMVRNSIPIFFERFQLKKLVCEPFAENQAPNRVLKNLGFQLVKSYTTTPGPINFEQEVNQWVLNSTQA